MKGDFSRDSFDPGWHFTRVLLQQGRVLTDVDFNEQAAIQQHFLRAFVVDLVGRRWRVGDGFAIGGATANDFAIGAGRFYRRHGLRERGRLLLSHAAGRAGARRRWSRRRGRSRPRVRRLSRKAGNGRSRPPRTRRCAIPRSVASKHRSARRSSGRCGG